MKINLSINIEKNDFRKKTKEHGWEKFKFYKNIVVIEHIY